MALPPSPHILFICSRSPPYILFISSSFPLHCNLIFPFSSPPQFRLISLRPHYQRLRDSEIQVHRDSVTGMTYVTRVNRVILVNGVTNGPMWTVWPAWFVLTAWPTSLEWPAWSAWPMSPMWTAWHLWSVWPAWSAWPAWLRAIHEKMFLFCLKQSTITCFGH